MADDVISGMVHTIEAVLGPILAGSDRYALLDFPGHLNIGDSAIYAGELAILDRMFGRRADFVSTRRTPHPAIGAKFPEGVLLLHGGGNFGDLWLWHQRYREGVIRAYPGRKIVQLPQSIHFTTGKNRDIAARAIGAHKDFTLLVRDEESLDFASRHFDCAVHLCPDMAYGYLRHLPKPPAVRHDVLCIMRLDRERSASAGEREDFADLGVLADWPDKADARTFPSLAAIRASDMVDVPRAMMPLREALFRRHARLMTNRGLGMLGAAKVVVTDRLHGHILSSLLRKPHVTLDNSYGKLSRFIGAWPADPYTFRATDAASAREVLAGLRETP